ITGEKFPPNLETEEKVKILSGAPTGARERVEYEARTVVNCAGPWASEIARILGYTSPTYNVRRQISLFDCRDVDLTPYGMIIDTSGVYFHPEATNGLAGFADHHEPRGINYQYDGEAFFMERIWPALYERSSAFERLRHISGWAGLYEVSPDESAILGPVSGEHSDTVFEAHSFSGHGVMHSYAAGLALAERMVNGKYHTIDAGPFAAERFESGRLIPERLVI
ncbi:MAG: NAD(P)/FAD-dependent oxidoreductase, partial [Bdellovibrionota bacterium]